MRFCYPGKGQLGDLPPRPECAPIWHNKFLVEMKNIKLILLIGQYSQKLYLVDNFKTTLPENIKNYKDFLPKYLPLLHPSPRNKIWQKKNPWFEQQLIPVLQKKIKQIL